MGSQGDYSKSNIDIHLTFDQAREEDFKAILNEKFGLKPKMSKKAKNPKEETSALEKGFDDRETELQKFQSQSQNALHAPLLTQAMVKRAQKCIDAFNKVSESLVGSANILSILHRVFSIGEKETVEIDVLYCP